MGNFFKPTKVTWVVLVVLFLIKGITWPLSELGTLYYWIPYWVKVDLSAKSELPGLSFQGWILLIISGILTIAMFYVLASVISFFWCKRKRTSQPQNLTPTI
jgi:hypothetical protein